MRLAFMGSPDFAVPALEALVEAGYEIAAVYAQPPRPAGRGKKERPTAVHARAEALGLAVRTPKTLRDPEAQAEFAALDLDAAVVAAYGLILPKPILDAPRDGCINIHPSLLPRWRGAAPIQRAVMAGDSRTGVSIMRMEEGLDTGPVLAVEEAGIDLCDTAANLHDRLAAIGARLLVETLAKPLGPGTPQTEDGVIYADKIDKAEARINWFHAAKDLDPQIRGLSPFPGAWCEVQGERLKVLLAKPENGSGEPGEILDDNGLVACNVGALRLLRLQRAGKPPMDAETFLRGFPLPKGIRLN